jgi:serine/threonine-protein kinase HipA
MEKVATIIEKYCTFPAIEKVKLFKLTLFNFLTGNEDMHLKNYSLITRDTIISLSPAYDLLNTTIVIKNAVEEIALPIKGRKRKLTRKDFIEYWGKERLGLNVKTIESVLTELQEAVLLWEAEINHSFLSEAAKEAYITLLESRILQLRLQ